MKLFPQSPGMDIPLQVHIFFYHSLNDLLKLFLQMDDRAFLEKICLISKSRPALLYFKRQAMEGY
jgi:hypothetical protein